jgi:hypothetical protein
VADPPERLQIPIINMLLSIGQRCHAPDPSSKSIPNSFCHKSSLHRHASLPKPLLHQLRSKPVPDAPIRWRNPMETLKRIQELLRTKDVTAEIEDDDGLTFLGRAGTLLHAD